MPDVPGRFEVLQALTSRHWSFCPGCGLPARRVVSRASIQLRPTLTPGKAAAKGLTTFKRAGPGQWEKVAGEGVDGIVGTPRTLRP